MRWFPQSEEHDVPDFDAATERSTYHEHLLSDNTVLYVLDR